MFLGTMVDHRVLFGSGVYHTCDSGNLRVQFPESFEGGCSRGLYLWYFCGLCGHLRYCMDDQVGLETDDSREDKRWLERAI